MNHLVDKLQSNLTELNEAAVLVTSSAAEMADGSNQVAQASSKQSESASGMAATMEELSVSISHVGERASEARDLSQNAGTLATSGEKVIEETIDGINEIATAMDGSTYLVDQLLDQSAKIRPSCR